MKCLLILALFCCTAVLALKKDDFGTDFPEDWYAEESEDDGLAEIPHFLDADEDFSGYFGESPVEAGKDKNVLQVAAEHGATMFVKAAILVGLKDELSNKQNITAFVPSNRAFSRIPKILYLYFLRHPDRLKALLQYHVLHGTFPIADLTDDQTYQTLLKKLTARFDQYTHAKSNRTTRVIQTAHLNDKKNDLVASNGMVHIIDDVILRLSISSSYDVVSKCPAFATLYDGLVVAGMTDDLKSGSLTVFAPTEKAFKRLPPGVWEKLLANVTALTAVLDLHVVPKTYFVRGLANGDTLASLNRAAPELKITIRKPRAEGKSRHHGFEVEVNRARLVYLDGATTTGILQPIDRVLLPKAVMEEFEMDEDMYYEQY